MIETESCITKHNHARQHALQQHRCVQGVWRAAFASIIAGTLRLLLRWPGNVQRHHMTRWCAGAVERDSELRLRLRQVRFISKSDHRQCILQAGDLPLSISRTRQATQPSSTAGSGGGKQPKSRSASQLTVDGQSRDTLPMKKRRV